MRPAVSRIVFGIATAPIAALSLLSTPAAAQTEHGAFVTTLGRDTMAMERFTRTPTRLAGEVVEISPRVSHSTYVVNYAADGTVTDFTVDIRTGLDTATAAHIALVVGRDSIRFNSIRGGKPRYVAAPAEPSVFPENLYYWGLYENATRAMARNSADSAVFRMVSAGGAKPYNVTFRRRAPDTLSTTFFYPEYWMNYAFDRSGRLLAVDGSHTTIKVLVKRQESVPLEGFLAAAVGREKQVGALGAMSPGDSINSRVGDAAISVVYSRPSARGRQIWGGLIPFGTVWRTGANSATRMHLSAPVEIAGTRVPAGDYTLFSLSTAAGASLIINKQVGQWGTEYHAESDLVRIPVTLGHPASPVELLTIRFDEGSGAARNMILEWGDVRWTAEVKPAG